jgi:hypothetical protein
VKIEYSAGSGAELSVKRCYIPCVLTDACPQCGAEVQRDLSDDYLSYPNLGEPVDVHFYHSADDHEAEWRRQVVLEFSVTEVLQ